MEENANLVADTVFMVDGIRCEILPYGNKRITPFSIGHYAIVADMEINGQSYEFADIFLDDLPVEVAKKGFIMNVVQGREKTRRILGVNNG